MKKIIYFTLAIILLGCSLQSETENDTTSPNEVSNFTAVALFKSVFISWTDPTNTDFKNVEIYIGENESTLELYEGDISSTGTTINSLENDTEYIVKILTVDNDGNKSDGITKNVTPSNTLTAELTLNDTYNYGENIAISLDVNSTIDNSYDVTWELDSGLDLSANDDSLTFTINLIPDVTQTYTLTVNITDQIETIVITKTFTVLQLSFLGTWKATNKLTPIGYRDIVGIWFMDGFHLYYMEPNGGEDILNNSAKGSMSFPFENEWITLKENYYWSETISDWKVYTKIDNTMYAKYNFQDNKLNMTVLLNLDSPEDTGAYSWDFDKIDDSIDTWF